MRWACRCVVLRTDPLPLSLLTRSHHISQLQSKDWGHSYVDDFLFHHSMNYLLLKDNLITTHGLKQYTLVPGILLQGNKQT